MEHVDVLIVGAGLSGIGAAWHLQQRCPQHRYAIVEAREAIGGTWDLFRYPGVRSDSDMYTLGYHFKPWHKTRAIADGSEIRAYVRETARENGIDKQIRFGHKVTAEDAGAAWLQRHLPQRWAYTLARWKRVSLGMVVFQLCRYEPDRMKSILLARVRAALPPGFDVDRHFTPRYKPWEQRLCLAPDGDLFKAIRSGKASVVTDQIDHFTANGITLQSGKHLDADLVVTATGLNLQVFGGLRLRVDGQPVDPAQTMGYKGFLFTGLPNFASSFGYTNASWTLKADLTSQFLCRLLNHMRRKGFTQCVPHHDGPVPDGRPWVDFSSGYFQRAMDQLPRQGWQAPWKLHQNYFSDIVQLRWRTLNDGVLQFRR